jgi:hypothetical protein
MRREVALLMLISLAGCLPDQAKDMAACRTEADRFYQTYKAIDPEDPSSQYIIACMAAKGYNFTILPADCDSQYPLPTQATCYAPNNGPDWIIDQFRRALN